MKIKVNEIVDEYINLYVWYDKENDTYHLEHMEKVMSEIPF